MAGTNDLSAEELSRLRSLLRQTHTGTAHVCTVNAFFSVLVILNFCAAIFIYASIASAIYKA